jgi:hypothetical protein
LVPWSIASSARRGIDARLCAAELGSSGNVGRGGLAELIGTTGSAVGFVFQSLRLRRASAVERAMMLRSTNWCAQVGSMRHAGDCGI